MNLIRDIELNTHGNKTVYVTYTNMADQVEQEIHYFEKSLADYKDKIIGLDVEYTWPTGPTQRAAIIQLCVSDCVLVYHISQANKQCPMLAAFLRNPDYTFAGVDIHNDKEMLSWVHMQVHKFVDIQTRWRVPYSEYQKDGLDDYAASIIDSFYEEMKIEFTREDHKVWLIAPMSEKHIKYAAMDAYATFEIYMQLVNFERGVERLNQPNPPSMTKRTRRGRRNFN